MGTRKCCLLRSDNTPMTLCVCLSVCLFIQTQEPIIISRGFSQPALCSPTFPPNQVAPSATPIYIQQEVCPRLPVPPLGHPAMAQWGPTFPQAPPTYQNSPAPPPQGTPHVLPAFDYRSMDQMSSVAPTTSPHVSHNVPPDPTPSVQSAVRPLPHLSRDDVLDVLDSLGPSSNQESPLDHTDMLLTLTHQDVLVFGDFPSYSLSSNSIFSSSTSLPAALHHEAGVEDSCRGYSRSLQPSPDPFNRNTFVSRKREGALCSQTEHKRVCQGSDAYATGPASTQTTGFPSYMKDMCSVESASQYAAGSQGLFLPGNLANHCAAFTPTHQGAVPSTSQPSALSDHRPLGHVLHPEPPHQSRDCLESKRAFLSSLCDLASEQHLTGSPPRITANQTPLLQIGHDYQRFI